MDVLALSSNLPPPLSSRNRAPDAPSFLQYNPDEKGALNWSDYEDNLAHPYLLGDQLCRALPPQIQVKWVPQARDQSVAHKIVQSPAQYPPSVATSSRFLTSPYQVVSCSSDLLDSHSEIKEGAPVPTNTTRKKDYRRSTNLQAITSAPEPSPRRNTLSAPINLPPSNSSQSLCSEAKNRLADTDPLPSFPTHQHNNATIAALSLPNPSSLSAPSISIPIPDDSTEELIDENLLQSKDCLIEKTPLKGY
jgi:hypothetical protein